MIKRELVAKIRKEFPQLKWKTAKHNVEGWDHYVLILDNKYVFRFPRDKEYGAILKKEIPLLDYLGKRLNLAIPQYKFVSKDKSFAGYELIQGIQLERNIFRGLPEKTKQLIAKQMAEFVTRLHRISLKETKQWILPKVDVKKEYESLKRSMEKLIYHRVAKKDKKLIQELLEEIKSIKVPNWVLAHNDLYPRHILLAKNKKSLSGIIDFADREINDPALDFCEFWVYGRKFVMDVYKYYRGPKDKDFIKRSIMYHKRMPLYVMNATPQTDNRTAFTKGYKLFKEIYRDEKAFD